MWTGKMVADEKAACEDGGGDAAACDCDIIYLETHDYQSSSQSGRHALVAAAVKSCKQEVVPTTTTVVPPPPTSANGCTVTVGTPTGTLSVSVGDFVNFYLASPHRDAPVSGTFTVSDPGQSAHLTVDIGYAGPLKTDDAGLAAYAFLVGENQFAGEQLTFTATVGGTTCSAHAIVH